MQRKSGLHKQAMNAHLLSECMCRHCKIATVEQSFFFIFHNYFLDLFLSLYHCYVFRLCVCVSSLFYVCTSFKRFDFEQNHKKKISTFYPRNRATLFHFGHLQMLWRCIAWFCLVFERIARNCENFCVDPLNYNRTGIYSDSYNFSYGQQPL